MDILNFISWIASKRRVVTSVPDDALVPVGIRTETRDDKYTTVGIKKSDLISGGNKTVKININGTNGLSNTDNITDFLVKFNNTVWNDSLEDFTVVNSKILINTTGTYLVIARYATYDLTTPDTDFLRLGVTKSSSSTDLGNRIDILNHGRTGTLVNGEALMQGSEVYQFNAGEYIGIYGYHVGANGGSSNNQGYPVFNNDTFNQPFLEIIKLS
jgi:hypothetical protein